MTVEELIDRMVEQGRFELTAADLPDMSSDGPWEVDINGRPDWNRTPKDEGDPGDEIVQQSPC